VLERRSQLALAAGRSSRTPVASVPRGGDADPTARRRSEQGTSAGRPL
jgi:hypothetical protein